MNNQTLVWVRCAGAAGSLGGLIWGIAIFAMATRTPGVPGLSYRSTTDLTLPMELALVLMVAGLLGLHFATAKRTGTLATAAVTLACSGLVFLVAGRTIMAFGNDEGRAVGLPGAVGATLGFALFGIATWRAGSARRVDGLLLCASALLLLGFNTEDWRAWFGLPFGVAWLWLGGMLSTTSMRSRAGAIVPLALTLLLVLGQLLSQIPDLGPAVAHAASSPAPASLMLNGSNAYAEAPHAADLNLGADWTIETWFKDDGPDGFGHPARVLLTKGNPLVDREVPYGLAIGWNVLAAGERTGNGGRLITYDLAAHGISPTAWHHVAVTRQSSTHTLALYVDSVRVAQKTLSSTTSTGNTRPLSVGRDGGGGFYWRGKLDDIRLWNVARSATDIAASYRNALAGVEPGLVANWKLDEGAGLTAADVVGAHTAALRGGAGWSTDIPFVPASSGTPSPTPIASGTSTPTSTPVIAGTASPTPTGSPTASATPSSTATSTATSAATPAATSTSSPTPSATATPTTPPVALPPDPAAVASAIDRGVATDLASTSQFLYTGSNPIQMGVGPNTIDSRRVAVLRGRVATLADAPLPGVTIAVLNHAELGRTLSRGDGMFDLAVNGGGPLTLTYTLPGYPAAQRHVQVPWRDYVWLPDVTLVPLDTHITSIDLASTDPIQVARGAQVTDADGTRQATLLFKQGTTAQLTLPGGVTQPLGNLHVRATEYTVGANGPLAMPADLPPASGYTYAVEVSVDEAIAAGSNGVTFNQPIPFYVDNFLHFKAGTIVPVGFYDRGLGQWVPSDNGRVMQVLAVQGGLASLDVDGSGQPASASSLGSLGITDAERQQVANLYSPGQSVWRAPLSHFSTWDLNWGSGPPDDATRPNQPFPTADDPPDHPSVQCGSIIGCESQTLGEVVELTGTSLALHYAGDRVPGRTAASTLRIPLSGASVPPSLTRIDLEVQVAGRKFNQSFGPGPDQSTTFTWDGKDGYGRLLQGSQPARVGVGYAYQAVYKSSAQLGQVFGAFGDSLTGNRARNETVLWQWSQRSIGPWDARPDGLGGWSVDAQHAYDPVSGVLFLGDGTRRDVQGQYVALKTIAGADHSGFDGDGGPATGAVLHQPTGLAVGPDGSVYIADSNNGRVRRLDANGVISTVAGTGQSCAPTAACGDGGTATAAALCTPWSLAFGADGSMYIADSGCGKIRRITPGGIISTLAGTGEVGATGDGGPAIQASLHLPHGIAVGPDGAVYVADRGDHRVRRIDTQTGIIQTVVGTGTSGFTGDSGPASRAQIDSPFALAFGPDGSLYIADWGNSRVRRVAADGVITTFAGSGLRQGDSGDGGPATHAVVSDPMSLAVDMHDGSVYVTSSGWRVWRVLPDGTAVTAAGTGDCCAYADGLPATQALLSAPRGVAVGQDGALYISDNTRIRRAAASLPGFSVTDIAIASEDGRQVFQFDALGRHLQTVDALSGALRYRFAYDTAGRLLSVTDDYANKTAIEHDGSGNPSAIVAPGGQRTTLSTDANGFLASIADPAGQTIRLASAANGLLSSLTDARGNIHSFTHDTLGRLTSDSNPVGEAKTLARTELSHGNYWVLLTSKLNHVTSYQVERLSNGGQRRTVTEPAGAQTTVTINTDGSRLVNNPDGSIDTLLYGPDPRWGMQSPIVSSVSRTTPSGLVQTVTASRAVTLRDSKNLLSLQSQTDTLVLNGNTFSQRYDADSRTLIFTSPEGRQQTATLDTHGRIVSQLLAPGQEAHIFTYDTRGLLSSARQGSLTTTFAYDTLNRLTSTTDMAGTTRQFTYDAADRPTRIAQAPGGQTLGLAYDASGNRTHLTLPMGGDHAFGYSASDQAASYTPPGNPAFSVAYDLDGNALRATLPTGRVVDTSYDAAGRSTSTAYSEATIARTYADHTSRLAHLTRTPTSGGASEDLAFSFDGGLVSGVAWTGAAAGNFVYAYDASRRTSLLKLTSGADTLQTALAYDRDGLLTGYGPFTITRDGPAGAASAVGDGTLAESLSYDGEARETDRVLTVGGRQPYTLQLSYDGANRISQRIETVAGTAHTFSYTYDANGQLIQAARDGQVVETYAYDLDGNRIGRQVGSGLAENATYDAQDRLVQRGGVTYHFDADGFLTARGGDTFQYSARGELVSATIGGSTITYVYDGVGRRVSRTDAAGTTQYLYGDLARPYLVTAVRSPAGALTGLYYDQSNRLFALERGGARFYVATDQAGTPKIVLDANAASVRVLDSDSFGRLLADSNPAFDLPIGFGGGLSDAATGLVRLGLRDYDPEAGRWTARDPLLFGASQTNLYTYVNSDPVNWRDPSGTDAQSATSWYQSVATRVTDLVSNWMHDKYSSVPVGPVSISSDKPEVSVGGKKSLQVDGVDVVSADAEAAVGISTSGTACDPLFTYRFKLGAQIPALTKIPGVGRFFKADLVSMDGKFGQVENYHGLTTSITAANSPEVINAERY